MNHAEKISELDRRFKEPVEIIETETRKRFWGLFTRTIIRSRCWISFYAKDDHWFVLLTSHKESHYPLICGWNAIAADFRKDSGERYSRHGLNGSWEAALTMWPAENEDRAVLIFNKVSRMVDIAYSKYIEHSSVQAA